MAWIRPYRDQSPRLAPDVFVADGATITGDVEIGAGSSVWFGAVLRGDVGYIRIGARSNVQDLSSIHTTEGVSNVEIGDDVTIGHGAIVHGATVGRGSLIGMGSILLDNAVLGQEVLVGAGTLIPPRMIVPDGSLVLGHPGRIVRALTVEERAHGRESATHYVRLAREYRR